MSGVDLFREKSKSGGLQLLAQPLKVVKRLRDCQAEILAASFVDTISYRL